MNVAVGQHCTDWECRMRGSRGEVWFVWGQDHDADIETHLVRNASQCHEHLRSLGQLLGTDLVWSQLTSHTQQANLSDTQS